MNWADIYLEWADERMVEVIDIYLVIIATAAMITLYWLLPSLFIGWIFKLNKDRRKDALLKTMEEACGPVDNEWDRTIKVKWGIGQVKGDAETVAHEENKTRDHIIKLKLRAEMAAAKARKK